MISPSRGETKKYLKPPVSVSRGPFFRRPGIFRWQLCCRVLGKLLEIRKAKEGALTAVLPWSIGLAHWQASPHHAWRIIPGLGYVVRVTLIYKPSRPFGRATTLLGGLTNHGYEPLTNLDKWWIASNRGEEIAIWSMGIGGGYVNVEFPPTQVR